MKRTITFGLDLRNKPNARGLRNIFLRITYDSQPKYIATNFWVTDHQWNPKAKYPTKDYPHIKTLNDYMTAIESNVLQKYTELSIIKNIKLSVEDLKNIAVGKPISSENILPFLYNYCDTITSKNSRKILRLTITNFQQYLNSKDLLAMRLSDFTEDVAIDFISYMFQPKPDGCGLSPSTGLLRISLLGTAFDQAKEKGILDINPLNLKKVTNTFPSRKDVNSKPALDTQDIALLLNTVLTHPNYSDPNNFDSITLRIFLTSYYLRGSRYSDTISLRKAHFDFKNKTISIIDKKGSKKSSSIKHILLQDTLETLISPYYDNLHTTGFLWPVFNLDKVINADIIINTIDSSMIDPIIFNAFEKAYSVTYNRYLRALKRISNELLGKKITTHVARVSLATNTSYSLGTQGAQNIIKHKSVNSTNAYIKDIHDLKTAEAFNLWLKENETKKPTNK